MRKPYREMNKLTDYKNPKLDDKVKENIELISSLNERRESDYRLK